MKEDSIYLSAAKNVLLRMGNPMHYESMAKLSIELGFLVTDNKSPEITMSSSLSREVLKNPNSIFKKIRPGVYDISSYYLLGQEILSHNRLFCRIYSLKETLGMANPILVCNRVLFIMKKTIENSDEDNCLIVENGNDALLIQIDSLRDIRKYIDLSCMDLTYAEKYKNTIKLNREFLLSIQNLGQKIGISSIAETFDIGVSLFECCLGFQRNGCVDILGRLGLRRLQILSSWRKNECSI